MLKGPRIFVRGQVHKIRGLTEKQAAELSLAAAGVRRHEPNSSFRVLIEEKSRFIPKIWD